MSSAWWEAPLRTGVRKLLHLTTHIYFSSIEVRGLRNVQNVAQLRANPARNPTIQKSGVIFAGNHPSGLVDPMVIMSALPDIPMSSVAKFSLFEAPFVKYFLRAMRAVPVAQPYDPGLSPERQATKAERRAMNKDMFNIVQKRLTEEQMSIVIFPEGTCHSTPQIKKMRAGTARMALKVAASGGPRVPIIPVGLSYSVPSGSAFRAKVLIDFGKPIEVTDEILEKYTSGDPEVVTEVEDKLMKRIERHLRYVTIRVPDWVDELDRFCHQEAGLSQPKYSMDMSRKLRREISSTSLNELASDERSRTCNDTELDASANRKNMMDSMALYLESIPGKVESSTARLDASQESYAELDSEGLVSKAKRRNRQRVSVSVSDSRGDDCHIIEKTFHSRTERESSTDSRKRHELKSKGIEAPPKIPLVLKRQAARNAFFVLQGFDAAPRDWEFINAMHLARHIYKPEGVKLTLAQYASLTRNFIRVVLTRLSDPEVHHLWHELKDYQAQLHALGVTDSYIAKFIAMDVDGDGVVSGREQIGAKLELLLHSNRVDLLKNMLLIPFGLLGSVVHAPVAGLAYYLGAKMGVAETSDGGGPEDGMDHSVEATMRMVGGFVGIALLYPAIGLLAHFCTPYSPMAAISLVAISGYAAVLRQPVPELLRELRASIRMHSWQQKFARGDLTEEPEWLVGLCGQRTSLQQNLRQFADKHASEDMRGWWKDPQSYIDKVKQIERDAELQELSKMQKVTAKDIDGANSIEFHVPLKRNIRTPLERAVLTSFMEEGNNKALLWIPGRNDSFYHVHVLDRLLATGFDVHALDLRRCGRAKYAMDGTTETTPELLGHDSYDFGEYNEEIDAVLRFLKSPLPLSSGPGKILNIEHGGCGKIYENIVCYSHSTGGLVAASYGARHGDDPGAWRGAIDGFIFNSPFFDWNLPWYQDLVTKHINLGTGNQEKPGLLNRDMIVSEGGKRSE